MTNVIYMLFLKHQILRYIIPRLVSCTSFTVKSVPSHLSGPHNTRSLRKGPIGTERRDRVAICKVP